MRQAHRFDFPFFVLLLAIAACWAMAVAGTPAAQRPEQRGAEVGAYTGDYMIDGSTPRAFRGFKWFGLTTADFNSTPPVAVKPYGSVHAGREYRMTRISMDAEAQTECTKEAARSGSPVAAG